MTLARTDITNMFPGRQCVNDFKRIYEELSKGCYVKSTTVSTFEYPTLKYMLLTSLIVFLSILAGTGIILYLVHRLLLTNSRTQRKFIRKIFT